MSTNRPAAKHIPDEFVLMHVDLVQRRQLPQVGLIWWTFAREQLPHFPDRVVLAKLSKLYRRGLILGCDCGCRGDYVLTEAGADLLRERTGIDAADVWTGPSQRSIELSERMQRMVNDIKQGMDLAQAGVMFPTVEVNGFMVCGPVEEEVCQEWAAGGRCPGCMGCPRRDGS
jgi:hypothetical protein